MRSIEFQPAAKADLLEAWLQVAHHRGVNAADTYLSKLRGLCELIANQPEMGVNRPDVADGVQSFPVDSHVIYYEHDDSTLFVLRVWHTAQNPASFTLRPESEIS